MNSRFKISIGIWMNINKKLSIFLNNYDKDKHIKKVV
jgi:hypothetical protein